MSASLFSVVLVVVLIATVVLGFSSFSLYVLGAENPISMMWGWKTYASLERGISLRHPEGFSVDQAYAYGNLGRTRTIRGVAFTPPESYTAGTNLSSLTKMTVETIPAAVECTPRDFLYKPQALKAVREDGREYAFGMEREVKKSVVREERVYALTGSSPCVAVRYTVYSALIEVDDVAAVKAFDEARLFETFDTMRRSLSLIK